MMEGFRWMIPSNSEIWPWKIVLCLIPSQKKTAIKDRDNFWNRGHFCNEDYLQNLKIGIILGIPQVGHCAFKCLMSQPIHLWDLALEKLHWQQIVIKTYIKFNCQFWFLFFEKGHLECRLLCCNISYESNPSQTLWSNFKLHVLVL